MARLQRLPGAAFAAHSSMAVVAGVAQALSLAWPWNGAPQWWLQIVSLAVLAWLVRAHPRAEAHRSADPPVRQALRDDAFRSSLRLDKGLIPASWVQDASDWPEEKRRRFVIVDNASFGEFDFSLLANEWTDLPLIDLGVDLPADWLSPPDFQPGTEADQGRLDEKKPITCPECGHVFTT